MIMKWHQNNNVKTECDFNHLSTLILLEFQWTLQESLSLLANVEVFPSPQRSDLDSKFLEKGIQIPQ